MIGTWQLDPRAIAAMCRELKPTHLAAKQQFRRFLSAGSGFKRSGHAFNIF